MNSKTILIVIAFSFMVLAFGISDNVLTPELEPTLIQATMAQSAPINPPTDTPLLIYYSGFFVHQTDFTDMDIWEFNTHGVDPDNYIVESRWDGIYQEFPNSFDFLFGF